MPRPSVCLALALCATPSLAVAGPSRLLHDATVLTDAELTRGASATVVVHVTGAASLTRSRPLPGAEVTLSLATPSAAPDPGSTPDPDSAIEPDAASAADPSPRRAVPLVAPTGRLIARGRTGADGTVVIRFRVPRVEPGAYRLLVATRSTHGASVTAREVAIADRIHLHLRTDRGVYQPGQTIRWRVTALGSANAHPAAGEEVELVVRDPRDNAIWRGVETVPPGGMIAGAIPLADDLLTGSYKLRATVRDIAVTENVDVRSVRLPAFEVALERRSRTRLQPGGTVSARVTARYRYGEPVQGRVTVELLAPGARRGAGDTRDGTAEIARGRLDREGGFRFTARMPPAGEEIELRAVVVDGAGRRERATLSLSLGHGDDLRVALVPERPALIRGALHRFTAITTDGRGGLIPARVHIHAGGRRFSLASTGAQRISLRAPDADRWDLRVTAVSADGEVDEQSLALDLGEGPLLRLREAVVAAGQPIVVTGRWRRARGPVLATLLRDGAPIAAALARIDRDGALRAEIQPPVGSLGLVAVRLAELGWDRNRESTPPAPEHLSAYLRPAELDISIASATRHRPGQTADVQVLVRDARGRPVEGAALAASAVDERVLALSPPQMDLTESLRRQGDIDGAAALGLAFADLLRTTARGPARPRDAAALRAIIEALPTPTSRPELVVPAEKRWLRETERLARAYEPALERLVATDGAIGRRGSDGAWRYGRELWQLLARAGWRAADQTTPWSEAITWAYAVQVDTRFAFEPMARVVAESRLEGLVGALRRRRSAVRMIEQRGTDGLRQLVERGAIPRHLAVDSWGTALRVERRGGPLHALLTLLRHDAAVGARAPRTTALTAGEIRSLRLRGFLPARLIDAVVLEKPTVDLVSAGADLVFGTRDDHRREDVFGIIIERGVGTGYGSGTGAGHGGVVGGSASGRVVSIEEPLTRRRFDETVLWRAGIATDRAGAARLRVPLGHGITGWKVEVEALTRSGATGAAAARLETFLPLHLDAELPPRLAVGDRYAIPIAVANHSGRAQRLTVVASLDGALRRTSASRALALAPGATGVAHVAARADRAGTGTVRLALHADGRAVDRVERTIAVDPPGEIARGLHTADITDGSGQLRFDVPAGAARGSLRGSLRLFRGAADQALDGLDGMLQEPHGCFEQTSSTTYPNLLVLRLLERSPRMTAARARAHAMVGRGYQRLLSFEVAGGGFSWFGEQPANQALTAYGLMEFVDMAAVYPVDPALVKRTRGWLLGKQRGDGSWRPDRQLLHDAGHIQGTLATTAFVTWALAEAGTRGRPIERALAYLRARRAALARSPYLLALWAAAESAHAPRRNPALPLLLRAGASRGGGLAFRAGGQTLLHARGPSADVQVTALAATALARAGRSIESRRALDWLWQARSPSYGWGTTHSTVLALRAAALASAPAPTSGVLRARIDGRPIGSIDLASVGVPTLRLPALSPGAHRLTVDGDVRGLVRADLRVSWREDRPPSARAAGLAVSLSAPSEPVALGGRASFTAALENLTREAIAMPTAVLPIPPGFAADPASIARLREQAGVARVEDRGDAIVVYLLDLAPRGRVELAYRLDAHAACSVLQRPATAYAFYSPELRGRSDAHRLEVRARRPHTSTARRHRSPTRAAW